MKILETARLQLRHIAPNDAAFILELVNEPSWLRFIGDRGVRTLEDARAYILKGPVAMYDRVGFGLYLTELKANGAPIGICGLVKRAGLEDVDIGFALLPRYRGRGYAHEAAAAVLRYGRDVIGLNRIVAIASSDNESSIRLLEKIGLRFEQMIRLPGGTEDIKLFSVETS